MHSVLMVTIITECIVSLAELPLQITTCAEAVNDINEVLESGK
jgi:hypothetical protein